MEPIITVQNLSKVYRIGAREQANKTFRELVIDAFTAPIRNFKRMHKLPQYQENYEIRVSAMPANKFSPSSNYQDNEIMWALKNVSFEVFPGEVIGVIGRNGAGKSTLLKIISRITEPTMGEAKIFGRISSLIEVGTGFHPELTGRENIFLNGAILGMRKAEIEKKFDEIVDFSEVDNFLDTPVKHYSSGMYLRLAFSVAAHLEPDILLVDEVLAVGDVQFQKKCLGKMEDVAKRGRTVLFVSHNMAAINTLCEKSILLNSGSIVMSGRSQDVIEYYVKGGQDLYSPIPHRHLLKDKGDMRLTGVNIMQDGTVTGVVNCRRLFSIVIEYEIIQVVKYSRLFLILTNEKGEVIFGTSDYDNPTEDALNRKAGLFRKKIDIPGNILKTGVIYGTFGADVQADRLIYVKEDAFQVEVIEGDADIVSDRHQRIGVIAPLLDWKPVDDINGVR